MMKVSSVRGSHVLLINTRLTSETAMRVMFPNVV